jgi:predicted porin
MLESRMKFIGAASVAAAALFGGASDTYAQSNATLYGVVDIELAHRTGVAGGSETMMEEGALMGSRWGLKGAEDIGGGWKALFTLESGFAVFNGKLDQQGQLFGRQVWVGFSNTRDTSTNTVSFGRQYTVPFLLLGNFDPIGWSNAVPLAWPFLLQGVRFDNTIQYNLQMSGLNAMLQYSVGGQAGSGDAGSTIATGATYATGLLVAGFALEESKDANNREMKFGGIGATASVLGAKASILYELSLRDPDFIPGLAGTTAALANTSLLSNAGNPNTRRDSILDVGVSYFVTPVFQVTIGYLHDSVSGALEEGRGGDATAYALADYFLSQRTDIYAEADFTRLSGVEVKDPNVPSGALSGGHSTTEIGIGLRTKF